jgi:uncharacterized protein
MSSPTSSTTKTPNTISPDLLALLCCPETHQSLALAAPDLIEAINRAIAAGQLKNRAALPVTQSIDAGLVRSDHKVLYPVRQSIPLLLIDEAIALDQFERTV